MEKRRLTKFAHVSSSTGTPDTPIDHGNQWEVERTTGPLRLIIGPSRDHVETMLALSRELPEPFYILYVLLLSRRGDHERGRYQSPEPMARADMERLLTDFRDYFEQDGRHHVWVASPQAGATLVYDNHDVIYAYGPIERYEDVLARRGFREGIVGFPAPHGHRYNAEFDDDETRLMQSLAWERHPLRDEDTP